MKIKTSDSKLKQVVSSVVQLFIKGSDQIMIQVPQLEDIECDILNEIGIRLPNVNILVATESTYPIELSENLNLINFDQLFEKKISINGEIKRNEFELLLIDRVHYGGYDKYTTELEKEKTATLTNRIKII